MKAHAIMIAQPYQGHINPFVHLAIKLATKGITVTFINTEHAHHLISKSHPIYGDGDIFSDSRASGLDIRYATIPDGFPLDFDRDVNVVDYWEALMRDFPVLALQFVGEIIESTDPSLTPFLIADTFGLWPGAVAHKYNLVNVSFWTMPATVFALDYHKNLLVENGQFPPQDDDDDHIITYIPGVESISTKNLTSHLQEADATILHKLVFKAFEEVVKADFILQNTVQELETHTLSALNQKQPTYAIGPVTFYTKISTIPKTSMLSEMDCTDWLSSKPASSVLYVSFGSFVHTNKRVIQEIARGLLLSQVYFIWAIRPGIVGPIKDADILPVGFENEVKGRGLIVPWCNQLEMLSNPAVGGFLTHCGWNSVLESAWFGVPMICFPSMYDQPVNRKLVVDDWKIGISLRDGESLEGGEVAEKINKVMTAIGIKDEMKRFRSILHNALLKDGSSERNLDQFLKDLGDKIRSKKMVV